MGNLTAIVPYYEGEKHIHGLVQSIPSSIPIIVVDDQSSVPLVLHGYPNVRVVRPEKKLYFTGACNTGISLCDTDVLILNQDVELYGTEWLGLIEKNRKEYALIGERIKGDHPAFGEHGYVHGVFQYQRRDALTQVGPMDAENYPLWGASALWQWQICRAGFKALPVEYIPGLVHKRQGGFGSSIRTLLADGREDRERLIRTPPAISVVIPCYNHGRYIRDAVNSLIGGLTPLGMFPPQTFPSFEIIIVDDGSDDGLTPQQVDAVADGWTGIRVYHTPNGGTAAAHNFGIERAVGRYITTMSADDLREPWALEELYRTSLAHPHSLVYDNLMTFTKGGRGHLWKVGEYDFENLLYKNMVPVGTMFEKKAWATVGGYPAALRYGREDWGFAIAMGRAGYCGVKLDRPGYLYRREGQNRTLSNTTQEWRDRFLSQMVALFPGLYKGERPMGCCGGRGSVSKPVQNQVRAMAITMEASMAGIEGMVMLEYRGGNKGSQQWGGPNLPSRRIYIFGDNPKDKHKLVAKQDAEWFLSRREHGKSIFRQVPFAPTPEQAAAAEVHLDTPPIPLPIPPPDIPEDVEEPTPETINPDVMKIGDVVDALQDKPPEYIEQVLQLEQLGRQRKTLIARIEEMLAVHA